MGYYLITGAGGGMGTALARRLTDEGHSVWGLDLEPPDSVPAGETFIRADVTDGTSLCEAFERIRTEAGSLKGIIHTAGIYDLDSLVEMTEKAFLHDFDVNVFGAFRVNRTFLPLLEEGGRIVMISSELAPLHPLPFTGVYAVTKASLDRYAEALRMELQLLGYRVIVLRPGAVRTQMLPASTARLAGFCGSTRLYRCNAERFRKIVDRVEARSVAPERIAEIVAKALRSPRPKNVYPVNRNPMLLLYDRLPVRVQLRLIRKLLGEAEREKERSDTE